MSIFLGPEPTWNNKISEGSELQGQEKADPDPEWLEARFAGDDFPGKVVDHGPGAVFADQTG
jgi:hypothetical protein